MDCGAYNGDTVEEFIEFSSGIYSKIWAIEADPKNFIALQNFIGNKNYKNVELFNGGVWNESGKIHFDTQGSTSSAICNTGDMTIAVEKIDNLVGKENVNLIKMDIEGSELRALEGAENTIRNQKPALAICVYHKAEDLITIPQFIKNLYEGYKFYLCCHIPYSLTELVFYAIPE